MTAFLVFMIVVLAIIPATMLLCGSVWKKHPPADINNSYGYRTRRSMRNKETWDFAHRICAREWIRLGWLTVILTAVIFVPIILCCREVMAAGVFGGVFLLFQILLLLAVIPITECALKRKFGV